MLNKFNNQSLNVLNKSKWQLSSACLSFNPTPILIRNYEPFILFVSSDSTAIWLDCWAAALANHFAYQNIPWLCFCWLYSFLLHIEKQKADIYVRSCLHLVNIFLMLRKFLPRFYFFMLRRPSLWLLCSVCGIKNHCLSLRLFFLLFGSKILDNWQERKKKSKTLKMENTSQFYSKKKM